MKLSELYAFMRRWRLPVFFAFPDHSFPVSVSRYGSEYPSYEELVEGFRVVSKRSKHYRVVVFTGPLQEKYHNIVIDVDVLPEGFTLAQKRELLSTLSRRGLVLVDSPRGFHVHARVRDPPYMVELVNDEEKHVGEGASLQFHSWTIPPTVRKVETSNGTMMYRYTWVYNGVRTSNPPPVIPEETGLSELSDLLEATLGYRIIASRPSGRTTADTGGAPGPLTGWKPVHETVEDLFYSTPDPRVLPPPVRTALYLYAQQQGWDTENWDYYLANTRPYPSGMRFLVGAEIVLFLAHTVANLRWEELDRILAVSLQGYPSDKGERLDKKLRGLLTIDEDGRVRPRYSGLGPFRPPISVCEDCPYISMCRVRATPWSYYRRLLQYTGRRRMATW